MAADGSASASGLDFGGGTLDDFTVEKAIGRGHFSVVHRAIRKSDEMRVALKKVRLRLRLRLLPSAAFPSWPACSTTLTLRLEARHRHQLTPGCHHARTTHCLALSTHHSPPTTHHSPLTTDYAGLDLRHDGRQGARPLPVAALLLPVAALLLTALLLPVAAGLLCVAALLLAAVLHP